MEKKKIDVITVILICAAVAFAGVCAAAQLLDLGEKGDAAFAMDCKTALVNDRAAEGAEAPFVEDGVGYLPAERVTKALGGSVSYEGTTLTASIGETAFSFSDADDFARVRDGVLYCGVKRYCEALGLSALQRGGVFVLSEGELDAEEVDFENIAERLGYAGFAEQTSEKHPEAEYLVDPYVSYPYEQMVQDIGELERAYPYLIKSFVLGQSVEGRDIYAYTFGRGGREIIINAAIHGSEFFTTKFVMYMTDRYAYGYAHDETVDGMSYRELLDEVTFVIVPMVNPDGVNIAQNGYAAAADPARIRSMDRQGSWYDGWKANANGVDLNRNFPNNWCQENNINWPCLKFFCGYEAASEPEVKIMIELLENTPFYMLADLHTFGEELYWSDNATPELTEEYRDFANTLMDEFGYEDFGVEDVDKFGGYLVNYTRAKYDRFAVTIEMASSWRYRYMDSSFDEAAEDVYTLGLLMAKKAAELPLDTSRLGVTVNGERALYLTDRSLSSDSLTRYQLETALGLCGISLSETGGALTASRGETTFELAKTEGEYNASEIAELLRAFGASAAVDEATNTLVIEYFE